MTALSFADRQREARRLALLRLLASAPTYQAADTLLYQALPEQGVAASLDAVRSDLAWLAEQGLADVTSAAEVRLARITARGLDAAHGLAVVPGVARPGPGQ